MTSGSGSSSGDGDFRPESGGNRTLVVVLIAVLLLVGIPAIAVGGLVLFRADNSEVVSESNGVPSDPGSGSNGEDSPSTSPTTTITDNTQDGPSVDWSDADESPKVVDFPAHETAFLKEVRVAKHSGFDRVVFEFDGEVPGYRVEYVDELAEDGSGDAVQLQGVPLRVIIAPASGVDLSGDTYEQIYTGPRSINGVGGVVEQIADAGDFEGQITWGIGVTERRPFVVSTLTNPTRLVIDIKGD
ncbi:MAG: hypothetical protein KDB26_07960 [Microthrixaceae bacterium]|nr:hypothetical protein [Microthrixaceae bacterium]